MGIENMLNRVWSFEMEKSILIVLVQRKYQSIESECTKLEHLRLGPKIPIKYSVAFYFDYD